MSEELIEAMSKLSPEQKAEVLHFAEFLAQKKTSEAAKEEIVKKTRGGLGSMKGMFGLPLPDDFNAPLDDFKEYMS